MTRRNHSQPTRNIAVRGEGESATHLRPRQLGVVPGVGDEHRRCVTVLGVLEVCTTTSGNLKDHETMDTHDMTVELEGGMGCCVL